MRNQIAIVVILFTMGIMAFITFNSRSELIEVTVVDTPLQAKDTGGYLTFEAYQLSDELYRGVIAPVNFNSRKEAKTYKSIIEEGIKTSGVNFAGKYSVVTWGCGENCQVSVVIDVITGDVIEYGILSSYGLAYSPWSSLFIVNPVENIPIELANTENISSDFYILNDNAELEYLRRHVAEDSDSKLCADAIASARSVFTREVRNFSSPCSIPYGWEVVEESQ